MLFFIFLLLNFNLVAMEESYKDIDPTALYFAQEDDATIEQINITKARNIDAALKQIKESYPKFNDYAPDRITFLDIEKDKSLDFAALKELNDKLHIKHMTVFDWEPNTARVILNPLINITYAVAQYNKIKGFETHKPKLMCEDSRTIHFKEEPNNKWRFTFIRDARDVRPYSTVEHDEIVFNHYTEMITSYNKENYEDKWSCAVS